MEPSNTAKVGARASVPAALLVACALGSALLASVTVRDAHEDGLLGSEIPAASSRLLVGRARLDPPTVHTCTSHGTDTWTNGCAGSAIACPTAGPCSSPPCSKGCRQFPHYIQGSTSKCIATSACSASTTYDEYACAMIAGVCSCDLQTIITANLPCNSTRTVWVACSCP